MSEIEFHASSDREYCRSVILVPNVDTPRSSAATLHFSDKEFRLLSSYAAALLDARKAANDGKSNAPEPPIMPSASYADETRRQWLYLTIARGASAKTAHPIMVIADQDAIRFIVSDLEEYLASYTQVVPPTPSDASNLDIFTQANSDSDPAKQRIIPIRQVIASDEHDWMPSLTPHGEQEHRQIAHSLCPCGAQRRVAIVNKKSETTYRKGDEYWSTVVPPHD